jgi:O-succinylbenzoic acid--CoA ligase
MTTLAHHIRRSAERTPSAIALATPHGDWSYADLADMAAVGAAELAERGFVAADMAALAAGSTELALAGVAVSAAGLAFLPLDPRTASRRWPALASLAGARAALMEPLRFNGSARSSLACPQSSEVALAIATSGSEGEPKAVLLSHANLDAAAAASNGRLPLIPEDTWLDCLPLFHVGGMAILHRAFRAGATVLLHEGFDGEAVWRDLRQRPVTHLSLVPAMLARLLEISDEAPPASLRYALIGGSALSRPLFERAHARGWPLCPSYGMSECASQAATLVRPESWQMSWREGAVGFPLSGLELDVTPERRIRMRGPQRMLGYLGQPALTADAWFVTSDLGEMDEEGRLIVLGRADDVLVSGGENVHPLAVESCLAACPGVADVAVTALPDPAWGHRLVALVVGGAEPEQVRNWGHERLTPAERPREVRKVERLPRNPMGKLERAQLPALAG